MALMLIGAACSSDDSSDGPTVESPSGSDDESGATDADPVWDDEDAGRVDVEDAPVIAAPDGPAPDELVVEDLTVGDGTVVADGDSITVDYIGALYSDGTVFDNSYEGEPFSLTLGGGQVIPGWDEGLVGMAVGGRRQLTIPPDKAYGSEGSGDVIGPDATLVFVIDLRAALTPPQPAPAPDQLDEFSSEDLVVGDGAEATPGSQLEFHYVAVDAADGSLVDSTWVRGQAMTSVVGEGALIPGLDLGLLNMKEGGRRRLVLPPAQAWGDVGVESFVDPGTTIVFEVDLLSVQPPAAG